MKDPKELAEEAMKLFSSGAKKVYLLFADKSEMMGRGTLVAERVVAKKEKLHGVKTTVPYGSLVGIAFLKWPDGTSLEMVTKGAYDKVMKQVPPPMRGPLVNCSVRDPLKPDLAPLPEETRRPLLRRIREKREGKK